MLLRGADTRFRQRAPLDAAAICRCRHAPSRHAAELMISRQGRRLAAFYGRRMPLLCRYAKSQQPLRHYAALFRAIYAALRALLMRMRAAC